MNKDLEYLIEMALADGEVTQKERTIILNKAVVFGEDKDEIEMILDGKLQQLQANQVKPIKEKAGNIKTCPACGSEKEAFAVKCLLCGHEFSGTKGANAVDNFVIGYNKIPKTFKGVEFNCPHCNKRNLVSYIEDYKGNCYNCHNEVIFNDNDKIDDINAITNYIKNYNMPNDKEGLLNLIFHFYSAQKSDVSNYERIMEDKDDEKQKIKEVFKAKLRQSIEISKIMFAKDEILLNQLNNIIKKIDKQDKNLNILSIVYIGMLLIVVLGIMMVVGFSD